MSGTAFELEFDESFDGAELDRGRWIPHYLPHWSTWERAAARHTLADGQLRLRIDADQEPWCPELDGPLRVSSLQTALLAGSPGSTRGQHRFHPDAVVRNGPHDLRFFTPRYSRFETRLAALADPRCMVALWMIGIEDEPEHSAEICICEIFGRDVRPGEATIGMGLHPFGDPAIVDDFTRVTLPIDATAPHDYAAEWTPAGVEFFVDGRPIKRVAQSPGYPMQLMLNIYEFPPDPGSPPAGERYPKELVVAHVRGYRYVGG